MGRATRRKKAATTTRQDKDKDDEKEKDIASNVVQDGKPQIKRASRHSADTEVVLSANVLNAKPERRAARIANCKIAENAKSLLSGKSSSAVTSNPTSSANRSAQSAQSNQATTKSAHQVRTNRSAAATVPSSRSPATATPSTLNFRTIIPKAKLSTVTPHLMMTCEEDDLSEAQLDAHYKAYWAYQRFVEQLDEFKKQPDVQIVYLGPNDEIPEPPTEPIFVPITTTKGQNGLTTTASTSVSQICTATETSCSAPSAVAAGQTAQLITLTQGAPTNLQGGNLTQFMLLLDPNTRMLYSAVPTVTTAPLVAQPIGMTTASSLAPGTIVASASTNQLALERLVDVEGHSNFIQSSVTVSRLHYMYGHPRRTANKTQAIRLFEKGKCIQEIARCMKTSATVIEGYLVDSLFVGEKVDHVKLSASMNVCEEVMREVYESLSRNCVANLHDVQFGTSYTINQVRLCVARLYRNLPWSDEDETWSFVRASQEC